MVVMHSSADSSAVKLFRRNSLILIARLEDYSEALFICIISALSFLQQVNQCLTPLESLLIMISR